VYGRATDDSLDLDDQIVDRDFADKALKEWFADYANIRQMHAGGLPPAGVGVELETKADGQWLKSEVYEPGAVLQVDKGGFKAYSVGIAQPRIIRDVKARNGRIVGGKIVEVSLVDYPANPNCKFALTEKAAGDPTSQMQILFKMVDVAKGFPPHSHFHVHANGQGHVGMHGHAAGTATHDGPHDGASHSHSHPEEDPAANGDQETGDDTGAVAAADVQKGDVPPQFQKKPKGDDSKGDGKADPSDDDASGDASEDDSKGPPSDDADDAKGVTGIVGKEYGKPKELKKDIKAFLAATPEGVVSETDKAAQRHIKNEARRLGREDLIPEDWKEVSITLFKAADINTALQRLHDITCQAYSTDVVKAAYPDMALPDPTAKRGLWQLIQNATVEDDGTGARGGMLESMGKVYSLLSEMTAQDIAARDEMYDLFAQANKDILGGGGPTIPTPSTPNAAFASATGNLGNSFSPGNGAIGDGILTATPGVPGALGAGQISPTSYRRGFISAGHQRETGEGGAEAAWKPANAGTGGAPKTHGAVDGAHMRQSPGDSKRAGMDLVAQLHDSLMVAFPNINCCLEPLTPGDAPKAVTASITKEAEPDADPGKSKTKKAKKLAKKLKKAMKALKAQKGVTAELKKSVETLQREPDPARTARRREPLHVAEDPEVQKRRDQEQQARIEKRQRLEQSAVFATDPQQRLRAQDELRELDKGVTAELTKTA